MRLVIYLCGLATIITAGCSAISITPQCPDELAVGESGVVRANVVNPGPVPLYQWEAFPPESGQFDNDRLATTTFIAQQVGPAILRVTAGDGFYQVVSQCSTNVVGTPQVELSADPSSAAIGQRVTLRCVDTGTVSSLALPISQISGSNVDLQVVEEGEWQFDATETGSLMFECVGRSVSGDTSVPSSVTVSIGAESPENGNTDPPPSPTPSPPPSGGRRSVR